MQSSPTDSGCKAQVIAGREPLHSRQGQAKPSVTWREPGNDKCKRGTSHPERHMMHDAETFSTFSSHVWNPPPTPQSMHLFFRHVISVCGYINAPRSRSSALNGFTLPRCRTLADKGGLFLCQAQLCGLYDFHPLNAFLIGISACVRCT